ncbi:MAG: LamG-like jellyroll fold domain-containing protein [Kiritimatiellia bacterium]
MSNPGKKHLACLLFFGMALPCFPATNGARPMAERYPARVEDLRPTSGWAPEFLRPSAAPRKELVPIMVDWGENEIAESVVTFGVPFARGALKNAANARIVNEKGEETPAGFSATATWDDANGPVRWAIAHALLRRGGEYFLEYGSDVKAASPAGIKITESDKTIEINTGPLCAVLSREHASIVETAALDLDGDGRFSAREELVGAERSRADLPALVDGAGVSYRAGGAGQGFKMELAELGPQRAAVRREGWYLDKGGNRFCQFITYTYFYAGQAGLRHDHTLVVAFDSSKHKIRDIMLPLPLSLGNGSRAVFAGDGSAGGDPFDLPGSGRPYSLVQDKLDAWELSGKSGLVATGSRAGGWFGLADGRWGAFAGLADFWQQYPAELEADGGTLRAHLWPARGVNALDLRPSAVMGDLYPGKHVFYDAWYRDGLDEMTRAYGLGKTHNLYLNFFAAPGREEAWARTRAQVCQPVLALPDPKHTCGTDVLYGRVHPYDPGRFPEIEEQLDAIIETYYRQRDLNAQYGWINFGDVFNTGGLWRRWASMFYGFPNLMPRLYLRSGRRDAWDFHRVNTRHITDMDICHLDKDDAEIPYLKKEKGRRYGGNGCICHYAADLYKASCDHHLDFMLLDYYLNGNLRAREVARYYLDVHAAARDREPSMTKYAHRDTGGILRLFCDGYLAFRDPVYLSVMRQVADMLYNAPEPFSTTRYMDVYMNPAKVLYYQITGEERMRKLFLDDMDLLSRQRNVHVLYNTRAASMSGLANAWWFTGDEKYLPFMRWQLNLALDRGIGSVPGKWLSNSSTYGSQLPEVMAVLARVKNMPAPKGPALPDAVAKPLALKSNWAFYLQETNDAPFSIGLKTDMDGGFPGWQEWVEQLPAAEKPALLVLDPAGKEIKRLELNPDNTVTQINMVFPADGLTGTYVLVPASPVAPLSMQLVKCTLEKRVLHAGESRINNMLSPLVRQLSCYFKVPAGAGKFQLELKTGTVRGRVQYGVFNEAGDLVAESEREIGASPRDEWEVFNLDAGRPNRDEIWRVTVNEAVKTVYLRFTGLPGYVASSPEELFTPDAAARRELPPVETPPGDNATRYSESGLPWNGQAAYLAKEVALTAPDGGKIFDERQGTVEMWVKTADSYSTLANKTLVRCGSFSLLRRYNAGTYAIIANGQFQRFFPLPNNRWTHLAFTWQPSGVENTGLEIKLFADGIEIKSNDMGPNGTPFRKVPPGWSGDKLIVSGGMFISNLRVSGSVRYKNNFRRPDAPFKPDEDTRALCRFDSSGEAWIAGKKAPAP